MKNLISFIYGSRKRQLLFAIFLWASIFLAVIAAGRRYIRPKATGGPIALSFAALPSPLQPGSDFDLTVAANPNGLSFNAFELHFTFDETKVELRNPANPAGNFEKLFSSDLGITQTVSGNKIVVSGAKTGEPFSGNEWRIDLAKVKMKVKAKATGSANFVWDEKSEIEDKSLTKTNGEFPLGGAKGAKLYFTSEKTNYAQGENLDLKLFLDTADQAVNSVQFEFTYDDTAVTFQKESSNLAVDNIELSPNSGFDVNNPLNTVDTQKKMIRVGLVTTASVSGNKELATVKLKIKDITKVKTVNFSANDNSRVYDLQTKNILTERPIYSISIGEVAPTPTPSLTPSPTFACKPTNVNGTNVIYVTPQGSSGTCHNLQEAIDAVNIEGIYIKLSQGSYIISDNGNDFSIKIINKNKLTIVGVSTLGTDAVNLLFRGNRGGIFIENSTGSLEWMNISGQTSNGLIYFKNSPKFALTYDKFSDEGANTVQINNSSNISIINCIIKSGSVAIYPSNSNNIIITNNTIYGSNIGFISGNSKGEIKYNLIYNNKEGGIALNFGNAFDIAHNTIVKNGIYGILHEWRPERENRLSIANNIVVGHQFGLESSWSSTPSAGFVISLNDVWSNTADYSGLDNQTGKNGNISADPLFGENYCLQPGSPAIYGDVTKYEYMGHRGPCGVIPTPTPPSKEAIIPIDKKDSLTIVIGPQTDASQIRFAAKLAHVQTTPEMYVRLRVKDELAFKDIILSQGETTDEGETPEDTCDTPGFDEFEFWIPMKADDNGIYTPATSISPAPPAGKTPAVVSPDGWVTLTGVKSGRYYTFLLKASKTRRTQMVQHFVLEKGAPISQNFDWSTNLLAPGDLPDPNNNASQDCCVNSVDISLIWGRHAACCNASCDRKNDSSCPDWDKMVVADVNYDGFIDGNDISKVVDTLSTKPDDD